MRSIAAIAAASSAAVIASFFYAQYVLHLKPCEICLIERWPWYAALVIAVLMLGAGAPAQRIGTFVLTLVLCASTSLGLYHVAVEQHWILGPAACTGRPLSGLSPAEAIRLLMAIPPVRCDEVQWRAFHLSLAGWNAVVSFLLGLLSLGAFVQAHHQANRWIEARAAALDD